MKSKLLCFIVVATVLCSLFVISASAEDDYISLEPGIYCFKSSLSSFPIEGGFEYSLSGSCYGFQLIDQTHVEVTSLPFTSFYCGGSDTGDGLGTLPVFSFEPDTDTSQLSAYYQGRGGWNYWPSMLSSLGVNISGDLSSLPYFSLFSPQSVPSVFGNWLLSNTSYEPFAELNSGYYRLILPIDLTEPTWIGDRNTVWYNMRGRVITDDSVRAISFHRLGISYFVNEGADYGAGAWGIELRVDTNTDTNLEVMSITFDRNSNQFYWAYNDLVLDGFVGIALDGNYGVNEYFKSLFDDLFEPFDYVYTGNPWYDIVDGVVDALKIDVFGDFSPWDILVTFIGISVFIWLLKLLAGG